MKIAILGARGGVGQALVSAALADGHDVTAFARSAVEASAGASRLAAVTGDACDPEAIVRATAGQDVVCDCLGTTDILRPITVFSRVAENLARALKPEQLLIAVTGLGAGDSKGHCGVLYDRFFLPVVLRRIYADKDRQEDIIKERVARWIIVRPGFLTNGPRTGRYRALTDMRGLHGGKISRADVADFILTQARSPQFLGRAPMLIY